MKPLGLGLLVDSKDKLRQLSALVAQTGQQVDYSLALSQPEQSAIPDLALDDLERIAELDAWLVDVTHVENGHRAADEVLSVLLATAEVPVLLCDSSEIGDDAVARMRWSTRLCARLQRLIGEVNLARCKPAPNVWVLAASTGGPQPVREFLQALPVGLNAGFLYAQHIDREYCGSLITMLGHSGAYRGVMPEQGAVIEPDTVTIINPSQRVELLENSTLVVYDEPWGGQYQPSIDQLLANAASVKKNQCGVIVFSGMGSDGAASCRFVKQHKGQVWVQEPGSCVVDSMPLAALATKSVDYIGTPAQLAAKFVDYIHQTNGIKGAVSS
ncbi:chemotaxis protein CheB [Gilvimarinus agarilyticus]|uniref:chemotaxis protein CheB n=1 Tax=Gilvimarinus agarilyticus TaxID=679259 RepID=UPI0006966063|nr:chemotaxis protein CheB [Gilvimarinus agarilyticus]